MRKFNQNRMIMRPTKTAILLTLLFSINAHADFTSDLVKKYPAAQGAKIERAFNGFWSVVKGREILFVSDDLNTLINGEVYDLKTNTSISAKLREANQPKFDMSALNIKDAIKIGSGSRKMYVFSDPDCPYCKKFEAELGKVKNVEIYIFPFPLVGLHPNASDISQDIWCSPNQASAWHEYVLNGVKPANARCANPIERNLALAQKNQIVSTPSWVLSDGTIVTGATNADEIERQLQKANH